MARGREVDKAAVELVLQLKARNESLTTAQIGTMLGMDATTAGRIISCGSWEQYCEWKKAKAAMQRKKTRDAAVERLNMALEQEREQQAEEQVPGQMRMNLDAPEPMNEQTKMMRFEAAQVEKILMKLNQLNDTMREIIRCIRKE